MDYIKKFFRPKSIKYKIELPKDIVIQNLSEALSIKSTLTSSADLTGLVNKEGFVVNLVRVAYSKGINLNSKLRGNIIELDSKSTQIDIVIERNPQAYVCFFLSLVFAIIFFAIYLNRPNSSMLLFWAFAMLIGGPLFSIWFSNISSYTIQERFEILIKKIFKAQ